MMYALAIVSVIAGIGVLWWFMTKGAHWIIQAPTIKIVASPEEAPKAWTVHIYNREVTRLEYDTEVPLETIAMDARQRFKVGGEVDVQFLKDLSDEPFYVHRMAME